MIIARALTFLALAAIAANLVSPDEASAQALGGAPSHARTLNQSPYQSYATPRSTTRRRPGLFGRLFGYSQSPRRSNRQYGSSNFGWGSYSGRGYRTLCVRMCDGYYWPITFSASRSGMRADAARCENSCSAPAKLFYERSPGGNAKYMIDLEGKRYTDLPNAFRYREEYVENCRCKPEPWSAEARAEYEARADQHVAEVAVKPEGSPAAATPTPAASNARPTTRRYTRRRPPGQRVRRWDRGGIFSAWR